MCDVVIYKDVAFITPDELRTICPKLIGYLPEDPLIKSRCLCAYDLHKTAKANGFQSIQENDVTWLYKD